MASESKPTKKVVKAPENNGASDASVTQDEQGQTIIRNQVVAKIVGLAVREIEGVHRLVPFGAGQSVAAVARTVTGSTLRDLGVQVEVGNTEAAIDLRIVAEYGASIPAIAEAIRRNVSDRVETMTGLKVVQVNIDVVDLYFPESESEDQAEELALPEPRVR